MSLKKCKKCDKLKPLSEFWNRKKEKDGKSSNCKICASNHSKKEYYEKYKENHNSKVTLKRKQKKNQFEEYLKLLDLKCIVCGENHPAVLDFHHKNPLEKIDTIANLKWSGCGLETLKKEIDKCDVMCSNCHRKHHYNCRVSKLVDDLHLSRGG
jgi:hypothetical protein